MLACGLGSVLSFDGDEVRRRDCGCWVMVATLLSALAVREGRNARVSPVEAVALKRKLTVAHTLHMSRIVIILESLAVIHPIVSI